MSMRGNGSLGPVRDVLAIPAVRRLQLGRGSATIGETAATNCLAVYAFGQGGAAPVAVYGVARAVPAAMVAPLVMSLSDRVRQEVLLLATVIRTVLLGASAAAHGPAAIVVTLAAASSALAITYRPLLIAILPWLVRTPAELAAVNVLATTMQSAGTLAGPVVAAVLLAVASTPAALGVASGFSPSRASC